MSLRDSIARLVEIGYSISLDGGSIRFHYERSGEPPEEARSLLTELKAHKEEALTILRERQGPREATGSPQEPENHGIIKGIPSDDEIYRLKKPVPILSQYLDGKVVYLVAKQEMALKLEREGKVAFTPEEIKVMTALYQSMGKGEWVEYLKMVCQTKKVFEGSRVIR